MMQEEASALGIHLRALVEAPDGSTAQVTVDGPVGAASDEAAVRRLVAGAGDGAGAGAGADSAAGEPAGGAGAGTGSAPALQGVGPADALTFEHEHQDTALLTALQAEGVSVQPSPEALLLARDKLEMRRAMSGAGLPQPDWAEVAGSVEEMREAVLAFAQAHEWPVVLKTPRGGYDGHGVLLLHRPEELAAGEAASWLESTAAARHGETARGAGGGGSLGGGAVTSLLVEQAVPFTRELAVLLARRPSGQIEVWPVAESVQADGICSEVVAPAPGLDGAAADEAVRVGREVAERFGVTGVLAVEMFAVEAFGEPTRLFVNELAMRPHNSGHWTQDGAVTSQFAQHMRAVLDLPLGSPEPTAQATVMVNLLGGPVEPGPDALARAMALDPAARIHLYGKGWRTGRKLGHVNLTVGPGGAASVEEARERARAVVAVLRGDA